MNTSRRNDSEDRVWFRTDRFFKDGDKWYFHTREKTIEGPFQKRADAEYRLEDYIRVMNSGFMPTDSMLEMASSF